MSDKITMTWTDWRGNEQSRTVNQLIDVRDFIGHPGYALLLLAANSNPPNRLSAPDIETYLESMGVGRSLTYLKKRRWLFQPPGTGNSTNRDGKDSRAIKIMSEHPALSLRDLVVLLKERGIKRGKNGAAFTGATEWPLSPISKCKCLRRPSPIRPSATLSLRGVTNRLRVLAIYKAVKKVNFKSTPRGTKMIDAVAELIEHRKQSGRISPTLRRVYRFHKANPQVLDFLVSEMRVDRANGWPRTSLGSLWHYSRWVLTRLDRLPGETFVMANNLFPAYGRIIAILHPDLNGFFGMARSTADMDLGTALEPLPKDHGRGYIRKLRWADGTPLERGWRPATPHEPKPVERRERVQRRVS